MDTALAFTLATAAVTAVALALDISAAAIRQRHALVRRLDHPMRIVIGSTLCATLLFGTVRPLGAATPPPSVRIVETVDALDRDAPATAHGESHYTVVRGDSLWRIAARVLSAGGGPDAGHDVAVYWPRIYDANRDVIGSDPDLIHPGQVLTLPAWSVEEVGHGT